MSRYAESPLMEVSEGHDIPFGWQWLVLITEQPPLLGGGQWAKEATTNEALQAMRGDAGSTPRLHRNDWEGGGCEFDGGCDVDATLTAAAMRVREALVIGGGG